ncbi:hypothetical protein [uncultured Cohaesibacter sp.]|uniref:hypothetical protein n=1 Tax=uncultured Cohaesibacter sp. TaxID=1002546 RepID=UPI0029C69F91|nr:hypothetical protein [uncultured Cohaesibacter sp.]
MTDFSNKSDIEIEQWIANHQKQQQTTSELYRELIEERGRRTERKKGLNLEKSLSALKQAAIAGHCITYGDLAKASGIEWSKARHQMNGKNGHLDQLLDLCDSRKLPLLTAICVNQKGLEKGELEDTALAGFTLGARRIGRNVTDEIAFHLAAKEECWTWGKSQQ